MAIDNTRGWKRPPRQPTINTKLRQVIIDTQPFDMDNDKADVILRTICKAIVKGVKRDGFVTIQGLGRFFRQDLPARNVHLGAKTPGKFGKMYQVGVKFFPAKSYVNFVMCKSLNQALLDKKPEVENA